MLRVAVALLALVFAAVEGGILRKRLAADFPSGDDVISAFDEMADMKLAKAAKILRKSDAVRFSVRRAAMDINKNKGAESILERVAMDAKVNEVFNKLISQKNQLTVRDLTQIRQRGSPSLKQSVRAALDSLMADQSSRPLAKHLQQAWDADSVDEQLRHLNMALDVLDSAPSSSLIPLPTDIMDPGFAQDRKAPEEEQQRGVKVKTGDDLYAYGYGEHEQDLHDDWVTGVPTGLLEEEDAEAAEADEADEDAEDADAAEEDEAEEDEAEDDEAEDDEAEAGDAEATGAPIAREDDDAGRLAGWGRKAREDDDAGRLAGWGQKAREDDDASRPNFIGVEK